MVDGYQDHGVPWPVEMTRFSYITPFGGVSDDLPEGVVGLNKQALVENTALEPGDSITLTLFEQGRPVPHVLRPTFEVVALDFQTPDAFLHSVGGEAVLSAVELEHEILGLDGLAGGLKVVMNGVIAVNTRRREDAGA